MVVNQMIVLFCAMACGFIARKVKILDDGMDAALSKLVLTFAMPCMVVGAVINSAELPSPEVIGFVFGLSWVTYAIMIAIALIVPRALFAPAGSRGTYSYMTTFGNIGFMGFPVLQSIFGPEALIFGAVLNIPFNILCFTIGILMLSGKRMTVRSALETIGMAFKQPTLIGCLIAMILAFLGVHDVGVLGDAVSLIGGMTTPCALMIVGSIVAKAPLATTFGNWRAYALSLVKLVVVPLVVFFALRPFISDPLMLGTMVITAGMPVATNGTMLCILNGGDLKTMSQGTIISTIAALVTIPVLVTVLGFGA